MKRADTLSCTSCIAAMAAALSFAVPAGAATQPPAPPPAPAPAVGDPVPPDDAVQSEEVVVTGSSIRGAPPVGSSLIQLDRKEIESSTSVNTTDIIREIPQVLNFGVTENSRSQSGGATNITYGNSINIRGLGPYTTLTLVNGRRPINQGTVAQNFDPSMVPSIALERIEVVADGTSAVYGSDAIAGVANIILRRRVDGVQTQSEYGFGQDFHRYSLGLIAGQSWSGGRMVIALQHDYRSALSGLDRDFYRADLRTSGGTDYRPNTCVPGTVQIGTTFYPIPASGATSTNLVAGTANRCDLTKVSDLLPKQSIYSGTLSIDQDVTDRIRVSLDALVARRDGARRSSVAAQALTVPATNAFFVAPAGATLPLCAASAGAPAGTRCETVLYDFARDFQTPYALTTLRSDLRQVTLSSDIDLGRFKANLFASYGHNHDEARVQGDRVDAANLAAALVNSSAASAFNPFGGAGGNSPSVVSNIFNVFTRTYGYTDLFDTGAKIDGSLFRLPGGDVRVAIGGEYNSVKLRSAQLRGRLGALTGIELNLKRHVTSAYGELLVPIFGPDNATAGFQSLDLSVAGRIDHYNDVGTTKNPKLGINWMPVSGLKLHGSYGTSFRAPSLTPELISPRGNDYLAIGSYFDPAANGGAGGVIRGAVVAGSNPNIRPETARTISLGADYSPIPGALVSLNYFDVHYKDQIASYQSNLNILRQAALFSSLITRGAAATAIITDFVNRGLFLGGGSVEEVLASPVLINGYYNNLGITTAKGLDFSVLVPLRTESVGDFRFTLRGTRFLQYKVAQTPTAPVLDQLNAINNPLKLRMRGSIEWSRGPVAVNLFANYQNAYRNTLTTPVARVSSYTTFDLGVGYDLGGVIGKDVALRLNVTNLFDRDPPFVDYAPSAAGGGGGFDPSTTNPIGRVVAVSLNTKF